MIPRQNRFAGHGSLNYVYRHGRTIRGPLFAVKAVSNSRRQTYRVAVVVSRKINKSAVARNRMRRRLYEIVHGLGPDINGPYDIVITVFHDSVVQAPRRLLVTQVRKQLLDVGALTKKPAQNSTPG